MKRHAFAVVTDEKYFPGCLALLNSIEAYHGGELAIYVVTIDLSTDQAQLLQSLPLMRQAGHVLPIDSPQHKRRSWMVKQQVPAKLFNEVRNLCLLDVDLILLSRLDDVFQLAEQGKIVSCKDQGGRVKYGNNYHRYHPKLVSSMHPYFNSGFLCFNLQTHWDLVGLWDFASTHAEYVEDPQDSLKLPGWGDQGILNAIAAMLNKQLALHLYDQEEWCNSGGWTSEVSVTITNQLENRQLEVRNNQTGRRQRLLHCTGPKWWWRSGYDKLTGCGDVLACFEHFGMRNSSAEPLS